MNLVAIYKNKTTLHLILFVGCIIISLVNEWTQTGNPLQSETLLYFFTIYTYCLLMMIYGKQYFILFFKKYPNKISKFIIPALLLFWIGALIAALIIVAVGVFIWYFIHGWDLSAFWNQLINNEAPYAAIQFGSWALFGSIAFFYVLWKHSYAREQKLREEKLIYQYETLKNQVNPHFLFNSLNTLSSLVTASAESADRFINKLSTIYRYILENSQKDTVTLESEILFVKDYFFLQKIRDEEKINLEIKLGDCPGCKILPISLQLLIENALKHNIATRENPLFIKIFREESYIVVENNLQKMTNISPSSKTGLKNLGERIRLMTGKELMVEETQNAFIVKLPLITSNESSDS